MIVAEPTSWMNQTFTLTDSEGAGDPFGELALHFFGGGRLTVGDADYEVQPVGALKVGLDLTLGAVLVASARRPSLLRRVTVVTVAARAAGTDADLTVDLTPEGWFGRRWTVAADGVDVGRADWTGHIRSRLHLDVPDVLPLVARAFLVAVLAVQRRRERSSG